MTISELMNTCVVECTEDTSIEEAYELLQKCDHRMAVVVDSRSHRRPIGVVTEQSICDQVIARRRNPKSLAAGSAMDPRIIRVHENEEISKIVVTDPDDIAAVVVVNDRRQVRGVIPKERISALVHSIATTNSAGRIFVNTTPRLSPASSEIPAFGWIQ